MASPTVSVACSLASIAIITILTKEGQLDTNLVSGIIVAYRSKREYTTWGLLLRKDFPGLDDSDNGNHNIKLFGVNSLAYLGC